MRFTAITITPPPGGYATRTPVPGGEVTTHEEPVTSFAGFQYREHNVLHIESDAPDAKTPMITFQRPDGRWLHIKVGEGGDATHLPTELAWIRAEGTSFALGPEGERASRKQVEEAREHVEASS